MEQLTPEALAKPRILLATAGSAAMADAAMEWPPPKTRRWSSASSARWR